MRTEYAVEIYNKYDSFVEQIDVFETREEAEQYIKETDIDIDRSCEYFGIIEIEYDENGVEVAVNRIEYEE